MLHRKSGTPGPCTVWIFQDNFFQNLRLLQSQFSTCQDQTPLLEVKYYWYLYVFKCWLCLGILYFVKFTSEITNFSQEKEGESVHNFQLARAKLGISWVAFCLERDFWIWVWISKISKLIDNAPWNPTFSAASTRATISVKEISINTFLISSAAYFLSTEKSK